MYCLFISCTLFVNVDILAHKLSTKQAYQETKYTKTGEQP